jgi:hypothetical protein
MKKVIVLLVVLVPLIFGGYFYWQKKSNEPVDDYKPSVTFNSRESQWEFLIVSFGKTYFSAPIEEPGLKVEGFSKLIGYSRLGIGSAHEAIVLQQKMDILGKLGWEIVGVLGAIGGDQQMLFKRPYDINRSAKESKWIKEEGERIIALKKQDVTVHNSLEKERALLRILTENIASINAGHLVDLDELDRANAQLTAFTETEKNRRKEEARLQFAIDKLTGYAISDVKIVSTANTPTDSKLKASIAVDLTAQLLKDGNKYRLSEARILAREIGLKIYENARLMQRYGENLYNATGNEIEISVSIKLNFANGSKVVTSESLYGNWPERKSN